MRKILLALLAVLLVLMTFCVDASADLLAPQNLSWKAGSTATAAWNSVSGANYYYVKVAVYHQGTKVGETETGTSGNEIDLQSQINTIIGTNSFAVVKVEFSVCAAVISSSGGETVKSRYSEPSEQKSYKLRDLEIPSNLSLSNTWTLTWDTVDGADLYECYVKFSDTVYPSGIFLPEVEVNGTRTSCNMSDIVKQAYIRACQDGYINPGDEVTVSFKLSVRARIGTGTDAYELMTDFSEYSNGVDYSNSDVVVLTTPANLSLSNQWILTWDTVDRADLYECFVKFNDTVYPSGIFLPEVEVNGTRTACNVSNIVKQAYTLACQDGYINPGDEVTVSFKLSARARIGTDADGYDLLTEFSDYSNTQVYSGEIPVEGITLSPAVPILYKGNNLYLGVTIVPENAVYHSVIWNSSDSSVANIDQNGKITGLKEGTTTITATIGSVSQDATLTVYMVSSNVQEDYAEVTDTAGSIIDDIGNNNNPDISNTDISSGDVSEIHDQILEGIERGDVFRADWWSFSHDWDYYAAWQSSILALMGGGQFACGYDAGFEMYHWDEQGNHHTIGNITEFGHEVSFSLNMPELPTVEAGYHREFTLARIHEGDVKKIPVTVGNGRFSGESREYSDFVLMYKDVLDTDSPTPKPKSIPKTGDTANLLLWLGVIVLGLLGIVEMTAAKRKGKG